jgi:hypothetical protein
MALEKDPKNNKPAFNVKAYKHAISMIESNGGKLLEASRSKTTGKLLSSAAGKYHFLYEKIKGDPSMKGISKREFINDPELQEEIMDKALNGNLKGYTYGIDYARELKDEFNTNHTAEELAALTHFLGAGGVKTYLRDPDYVVPGEVNATGKVYADKFTKNYNTYVPTAEDIAQQSVAQETPLSRRKQVMPTEFKARNVDAALEKRGVYDISNQMNIQSVADSSPGVPNNYNYQRQTEGAVVPEATIPSDGIYDINNQQNIQRLAPISNPLQFGGYNKLVMGGPTGADDAAEDVAGGPGAGAYVAAAGTAMELGNMAFGATGISRDGSTPPPDVPSQGAAAAAGMLKGAAAGAAFGPWGAAIGGGVGAVAGFVGQGKQKDDAAEAAFQYEANMHNQASNSYAKGGMLKRADGSYSKRGLWDNIRDNKGSGKKPTEQMLAQERKINKMEEGGPLDPPTNTGTKTLEDKPPKSAYTESQQKAIQDSIKAIKQIYGENVDPGTINTILSNIEIETGFRDLREKSYSFDRIKELGDGDLYTANKNLDKWGKGKAAYNKLSKPERISVMYYGDTDHADIAGGTGVLQLTSANYGGNHKTEGDITKASKQLGIKNSGLANNFYDSTLLSLQVMKNRGHDFSSFGNAKDARFSVVNPGQDYDKMDEKKKAILDNDYSSYYGNMNQSVDPSIITNNTGLDQSTKDRFLKANEGTGLTPDIVDKLTQQAPIRETNPMLSALTSDPNKDLFSGIGMNYQQQNMSSYEEDEMMKNIQGQNQNQFMSGGEMNSQVRPGGGASELVTLFENGGSHSQNSLGGIPQGVGANGKPNLVEEGETKWNDYIFSNSIDMDGNFTGEDGNKTNVFKKKKEKNSFNIENFKL